MRRQYVGKAARVALVAAAVVLGWAAAPAYATIIIGAPADPNSGNCFPFGCDGGSRYQQVYSAGEFSGPISIESIIFYADAYTGDTNTLASGSWDLYLSTTAFAVNDIDSRPFDSNLGADQQLFATVTGGGVIPNVWVIPGSPFTYDPSMGNLLLDVHANLTGAGNLYLNARNGTATGQFSRWHDFGDSFDDWGLVTGFEAAPVPEPGTLLLIGSGLAGLAMKRRRNA